MWPGQKAKAGSRTPPSKVVPFPHRRRPEQPPWDIRMVSGLGHTGTVSFSGLPWWPRPRLLRRMRRDGPQVPVFSLRYEDQFPRAPASHCGMASIS